MHISIIWPSLVNSLVVVQKIYWKIHPVSHTNTHHHILDLENHGMVKITKTWMYWEQNRTELFYKITFLTCTSDDTCWENIILCWRWLLTAEAPDIVLVSFLLTLMYLTHWPSGVLFADYEHENAGWNILLH